MKLPIVFCPRCEHLLDDYWVCDRCQWERPVADSILGQARWPQPSDVSLTLRVSSAAHALQMDWIVYTSECGRLGVVRQYEGVRGWQRQVGEGMIAEGVQGWGDCAVASIRGRAAWPRPATFLEVLSLRDGRTLWRHSPDSSSISAPAVRRDTAVFVADIAGSAQARAVNLQSRQPVWTEAAISAQRESPTLTDDSVYLGVRTNQVLARDLATGAERWRTPVDGVILDIAADDERSVFVVTSDRALYQLSAGDGRLMALTRVAGEYSSRLALTESRLFVAARLESCSDHQLLSYFLKPGQIKYEWSRPLTGRLRSGPLVAGSIVAACVEAQNGTGALNVWDQNSPDRYYQQVYRRYGGFVSGLGADAFYVATRDGQIAAHLWRMPTDLAEPIAHYEAQKNWEAVGIGYTLQKRWREAAVSFEKSEMWRRAAELYEKSGDWESTARVMEQARQLNEALAIRLRHGDQSGAARLLVRLGRLPEAGAAWEKAGDWQSAARAYIQADKLDLAIALLNRHGRFDEAGELLRKLPSTAQRAIQHELRQEYREAAAVWQALGRSEQAALAYEQAGNLADAAALYRQTRSWSRLAGVARTLGDHLLLAEALEEMAQTPEDWEQVARCNVMAAESITPSVSMNLQAAEPSKARLHEKAALCFRKAYCFDDAQEQDRLVLFYRKWPKLVLQLQITHEFAAGEFDDLDLTITNVGHGSASNIRVDLDNAVLPQNIRLAGLRSGYHHVARVNVFFRDRIGAELAAGNVKLAVKLSYQRPDGERITYEDARQTVPVRRPDQKQDELKQTIIIAENFYQSAGDVVQGSKYTGPTQIGDRVQVTRVIGKGKQAVCPNPTCRWPLVDSPGAEFCQGCGQRLSWD